MKLIIPILTASLLLTQSVESRWMPKPGLTWSYGIALKDSDLYVEKYNTIQYNKIKYWYFYPFFFFFKKKKKKKKKK